MGLLRLLNVDNHLIKEGLTVVYVLTGEWQG